MQISGEGKLGLGLALMLGLGSGAAILWPDHSIIGWVIMAGSAMGLAALAIYHFVELWKKRNLSGGKRVALAFAGMIVLGLGTVACAVAYFWPSANHANLTVVKPTMLSLFATDFSEGLVASFNSGGEVKPIKDNPEWVVPVRYRVINKIEAHVKFLSIYMDKNEHTLDACNSLAANIPYLLDTGTAVKADMQHGSTQINSAEFAFSGIVYLYYNGHLPIEEVVQLKKLFKSNGVVLQFFSSEYAEDRWKNIQLGKAPPVPAYEIRDNILAEVGKNVPYEKPYVQHRLDGPGELSFRLRDSDWKIKETVKMNPVSPITPDN